MPVEMAVDRVVGSPNRAPQLVVLTDGTRAWYLPITVGAAEAFAIRRALTNRSTPRPLTHELLYRVVTVLGAQIVYVLVHAMWNETFHARLVLRVGEDQVEIDCRPSDGVALALRASAPILVSESVLEAAGVQPPRRGPATAARADGLTEGTVRSEQLSAFRDVIDHLDLDDLGAPG